MAAGATILNLVRKIRLSKTSIRTYRSDEDGHVVIQVKPSKLLEDCRIYLGTVPLRTRDDSHANLTNIDIDGKYFDIPNGLDPQSLDVSVYSRERHVYRKTFDKLPYGA